MDGSDIAYKHIKCYCGNVEISVKSVVFVTILALYCYALCNVQQLQLLLKCTGLSYPLNSGD